MEYLYNKVTFAGANADINYTYIGGLSSYTTNVDLSSARDYASIENPGLLLSRIYERDIFTDEVYDWAWSVGDTSGDCFYLSRSLSAFEWFANENGCRPGPTSVTLSYTSACFVTNAPFSRYNGLYVSTDPYTHRNVDNYDIYFQYQEGHDRWVLKDLANYEENMNIVAIGPGLWEEGSTYPWIPSWNIATVQAQDPFASLPTAQVVALSSIRVSQLEGSRGWSVLNYQEEEVEVTINSADYNGTYNPIGYSNNHPVYQNARKPWVKLLYSLSPQGWHLVDTSIQSNPYCWWTPVDAKYPYGPSETFEIQDEGIFSNTIFVQVTAYEDFTLPSLSSIQIVCDGGEVGEGCTNINGVYTFEGYQDGRPFWSKPSTSSPGSFDTLSWSKDGWMWMLYGCSGNFAAYSLDDVPYPWLIENWYFTDVTGTTITISIAPTQNTHNLPEASVALISQNFGSVENYLRLRNLGQV